tara:strand:- start:471 stop:1073 length:603 start_codon:yes stop_codon:yes gene_type:complete
MEKFTGKGKSPKLRKLLEGGSGGSYGPRKIITIRKKSSDFPKIMDKMKMPSGYTLHSNVTGKRIHPLITKAEVRSATLKVKANIEKQKKVPGYVQTKTSKKITDKFITRETKVSLTAPFKTVGEQRKVINQIKSNVQVRQLNRTLKGTKKDTNYKTPPASLQKSSGRTLKKTKKVLKEPDSKKFAQDVKSYVKLKNQKKK